MKKIYFLLFALLIGSASFAQTPIITAILDGDCSGGNPKLLEIYADGEVDFTLYSLENQTNANTTWGATQDLSSFGTVTDGFVYITTTGSLASITTEFPSLSSAALLESNTMNVNGDDRLRIVLTSDTTVIDQFGAEGVDGSETSWEYTDSYAKRVNGTGPDAGFAEANWIFGGAASLDLLGVCQGGSDPFETLMGGIGTYTATTTTDPTLIITSPTNNAIFPGGTTSVDININVQNFVVGNPGAGIDGHIHWTINGVAQPMKYNTNTETITVTDDESYTVFMQLVDNSHTPIAPAVNATVNFSVAFPCDLSVGTITPTCDAVTGGIDTYTTTLEFTGGGTTTYTIDTGGVGTVSGDDPSTVATGTITISGVNEGTDFVVTFTGNPANSSCDFTRSISAPDCIPSTPLPIYENFNYGAAAGDLTAVSGGIWVNHSGTTPVAYSTTSLSMSGYPSSGVGGSVTLTGANSEDVKRTFTEQTSGTVYMSALVNLSSVSTGNYFMHLNATGTDFVARVGAQDDGGGNVLFGIGTDSGTLTYGTTPFSLNTTYLVVASYNIDTDVSNLYVLTAPVASEPSTPEASSAGSATQLSPVSSVSLRQSSNIPDVTIDGLNVSTTWEGTLSTNNIDNQTSFAVYPNPTSLDYVNITSNNIDAMSVVVFDVLGKQVLSQTVNNNRLNVASLKSGIYIMRISQNNATISKKLIIK